MKIFFPGVETFDKGHGRLEIRKIETSTSLNDYLSFPYTNQVFRITRTVIQLTTEETTTEIAYGITSLTPEKGPQQKLLDLVRGHWAIENKSHYVRDVTFDEDRSQIRTRNGPRVMAALRNFAIGLLRLIGAINIAEKLREIAHRSHLALNILGV